LIKKYKDIILSDNKKINRFQKIDNLEREQSVSLERIKKVLLDILQSDGIIYTKAMSSAKQDRRRFSLCLHIRKSSPVLFHRAKAQCCQLKKKLYLDN
jgi:hypothetical protein